LATSTVSYCPKRSIVAPAEAADSLISFLWPVGPMELVTRALQSGIIMHVRTAGLRQGLPALVWRGERIRVRGPIRPDF
jgi:hypothetical protein